MPGAGLKARAGIPIVADAPGLPIAGCGSEAFSGLRLRRIVLELRWRSFAMLRKFATPPRFAMVTANGLLILIAFYLISIQSLSSEASDVMDFSSVTGGYVDSVPRVIGWEFTTGTQPITITDLGVFDFGKDGLLTSHSIAIYDAQTHNSVVSALVPSGSSSTLSGFFRFVPSSPTILQANSGYIIAASWAQNSDAFVWSNSIGSPSADIIGLQIDPSINLGITGSGQHASARFEDTTSTLQFPTKRVADVFSGDARTAFVGPNFRFTTANVPEPSTYALGLIAAGALAWLTRRRKGPQDRA